MTVAAEISLHFSDSPVRVTQEEQLRFDPLSLVGIAAAVAREAGDLARNMRDSAVADVDTKSTPTDVVTAGDRAAEQLVRRRLATLRPGEPVLGEEEGGEAAVEGLTWVVDPIDGTVNYLYDIPHYAVSLAA